MDKQLLSDIWLMNIALKTAIKSKCISRQVGCVLAKEDRIISQGYNGTPSGQLNCNQYYDFNNKAVVIYNKILHSNFSKKYEIHAEMNAILWAAKNGINVNDCTCYVNFQPCWDCTKNMIQAGIKRIVYVYPWEKMTEQDTKIQTTFLLSCGVKIIKLSLNDFEENWSLL